MSNQAVQYEYQEDMQTMENDYPCNSINWEYKNDVNNGNYAAGQINFGTINFTGTEAGVQFSPHKGFITVPYTVTLDAINCTFTSDDTTVVADNKYALGSKGYHHFIDKTSLKVGGTQITENNDFQNLVSNEHLKNMNQDEKLLMGSILNYELDSTDSFSFLASVGEVNNAMSPYGGTSAIYSQNNGHVKRMNSTNLNAGWIANSGGLITSTNLMKSLQSTMSTNTASKLEFTGVATIPLHVVHKAFENMPSLSNINQMILSLQTNIGAQNSYLMNFTGRAQTAGLPNVLSSIDVNQAVGRTCPFLVSSSGEANSSGVPTNYGLTIHAPAASAAFSVKLTAKIGYNGSTTEQCKLYIPVINLAPTLLTKVLSDTTPFRLLYNDYYITEIQNVATGAAVKKTYDADISRPRTLYLVPFASGAPANAGVVRPYQSPVSSAPTTCTPCRLENTQIKLGGSNIYPEPINYTYENYNEHIFELLGTFNGNSSKSNFKSGLIAKNMYESCYGVPRYNIEKVLSQTSDDKSKQFILEFRNSNSIAMDYLVIIEYQKEVLISRSTGIMIKPDKVSV